MLLSSRSRTAFPKSMATLWKPSWGMLMMIRKPDGGVRFCINYRKLNAVTIKDTYPMPLIDDILDVLNKAKLFSTMDIASGYWNVPMDPDSIEKTAFTRKFGLYEWRVMPFGLCNAVHAFERLMEMCWWISSGGLASDDFRTHLVRVRQALERFRAAGFKLKMKKCHWGRNPVAFLDHIVTPSGILTNPEKVKAVMNVARPHALHMVRAFLDLTSCFRRYIPGFGTIAAPLERLKERGTVFRWNEDCEVAFNQLQRSLRFKLYGDLSYLAVGACLMQEVDDRDRAVAFASKMFVDSQRHLIDKTNGITEIECWGVAWSTRKFRWFLDHSEFNLVTDHQALTGIFSENTRSTIAKLARWAMELSQLRCKIHHRAGTLMGHADGLSRFDHLPTTVDV
ncbi:Retrovirus-related Pol Polyprotein from transposon 412 [Phytophthora megakarya]|uniref:Retrovirus-related Pol Polyprotein from transposon 412 n=1 Tax=Phytophthora megakarya TaxID=4795 RepID=A0A225VTF9_9STRA|nr:Retrovirus-related Pol Polyprotein from transposon 412 [Phytophthora megakarya]